MQLLKSHSSRAPGKPLVLLCPSSDPEEVADQALRALTRPPLEVFTRGGRLVRVRTDGDRAHVERLDEAGLLDMLVRRLQFVRWSSRGNHRYTYPPRELVRTILSRESWPLPQLRGVAHHPLLRPDGTIHTRQGFDLRTCFFCFPGADVPKVVENPTARDRVRALEVLDEALCDFPFVDQASRANALALLLTPVLRTAFSGPVPLFVISKPTPGTGATLLAQLAATVATGDAIVTNPPEGEEEARKAITGLLSAAQPVVVFDDVTGMHLRTLSRLLTATTWQGRLLGTHRLVQLEQLTVWVITGNNVSLGADLARRAVLVQLDAKCWRPWERTGFRHPDLLGWAREHRGELLWALLVLARSWYVAGCPPADVPAMGSFEAWARVTGGVLAHAGVEGFLRNQPRLYDELDQQHAGWPEFLAALQQAFPEPFTAKDAVLRLREDEQLARALPDALSEGTPSAKVLSEALRRRAGMRLTPDGLRVERAGRGRSGVLWQVVTDHSPQPPEDVREQRQRAGLCPGCGGPIIPGFTLCSRCTRPKAEV